MSHLRTLRKAEKQKVLDENVGILARIAEDLNPPCSPSLVSRVFWGSATSRRVREAIERKLAEIGAAA